MTEVLKECGTIAALLAKHGLGSSQWRELPPRGYSGARLYSGVSKTGRSWVLKRTSLRNDWPMRATADFHGRECRLATTAPLRLAAVRSAAIGGAREGEYFYTLMHDISSHMFGDGVVDTRQVEAIIAGIVRLHSATSSIDLGAAACDLGHRLLLLSRGIRAVDPRIVPRQLARDINAGWNMFSRRAPRKVRDLIADVQEDFTVLGSVLAELPATVLHGDLKLDNLGVDGEGTLWLIDWALTCYGPVCVELGWFIAVNSQQMLMRPQEVLDMYSRVIGLVVESRRRHEALTALCGLLLRGWRKALDADSTTGRDEFAWWCDHASQAEGYLRLH